MILAPDCPLCLNYASRFQELAEEYPDASFYGVLPGTYYSESELSDFLDKTAMTIPVVRDENWSLCKSFNATVTPEFFLYENGKLKYSGKMDDWASLIGRKNRTVKEKYLKDALSALYSDINIEVKRTQPVGCILEYD
jgi:thiol-disulfide isomerase/thioredoxin